MISVRCPLIAIVALVTLATATLASAHSHHHHHDGHGFRWWVSSDGQSQSQALANCLCWNATSNNWCHHPLDGHHTGFWRDSCARVVYYNTWWWIPVTLWCMYLIFMPLFMCAFRLCCNCCGGRTPSFGCCCPISNAILSPDPKWKRPYSRCATWTAKILALFFGITMLSLSIHIFHRNQLVGDDVQKAQGVAQTFLQSNIDGINLANMETYPGGKPSWLNAAAFGALNQVQSVVSTLQTLHHDFGEADHYDREKRMITTNATVGLVLFITVLVTLLGLCNVRSWPISISAGILSFLTLLVVIIGAAVATAGVAVNVYCDNADTVKSFTKELFQAPAYGYCGRADVTRATNQTQMIYVRHLCQDLGLSAMLAAGNTAAEMKGHRYSLCEEKLGGMLSSNSVSPQQLPITAGYFVDAAPANIWLSAQARLPSSTVLVDVSRLGRVLADGELAPVPNYKTTDGKAGSIMRCTVDTKCPEYAKWSSLDQQWNKVFAGLTFLMAANMDCHVVDTMMDQVLTPTMCNTYSGSLHFRKDVNKLGGLLLGLGVVATFAFWVWMNGSKRFAKAASKEELLGHHDANRQHMAQLSYDYMQAQNAASPTAVVAATPVPQVYNDGVHGPKPVASPASPAVANTTEQPLLLHHDTPTYGAGSSVNNRPEADVELPVKEQPPLPV